MSRKEKEIERLNIQQEELSDLLTDIKGSLNICETNLRQK